MKYEKLIENQYIQGLLLGLILVGVHSIAHIVGFMLLKLSPQATWMYFVNVILIIFAVFYKLVLNK